jgi:glucokinase
VSGCTAAIDLGGTHVRAAVVTDSGRIVNRIRRKTPGETPRPDVLPALIHEVAGGQPVASVVVGVPGVIDHDADMLERAPNLPPRWIPWLTGAWLSEQIGAPVSLANDCDLAAVGEASFGAGRDHRDVVYVTISTGVGAGLVVNRAVVRGQHSGGEIGHTIVDLEAARAGKPCTVEDLAAGPAIAAAAARAGLAERDAELAELVRSGHPVASSIWYDAIEIVAFGVVNLAWLLAPQVVVIGGGVGNNHDLVLPTISRVLADLGPAVAEPIPVVGAALGDDAALHGAATWFEAIGRGVDEGAETCHG